MNTAMITAEAPSFSEEELPYGELELVTPDGRVEHTLDWQSERVVPLLRHVHRLTAPNPGRMTGPGTNTYVVGTTRPVVIDPGPADTAHVERLWRAAGGQLSGQVKWAGRPATGQPLVTGIQMILLFSFLFESISLLFF